MRDNPVTHCVIVRPALERGLLAAMIVHAAGESSMGRADSRTHALALEARSVEELEATATEAERRGLAPVRIVEPDAPWNGQLMAVGIPPHYRDRLRWLQHLPLIRSGSSEKEHRPPRPEVAGSSPAPSSIQAPGS